MFADKQVKRDWEFIKPLLEPIHLCSEKTVQANAARSVPWQECEADARPDEQHTLNKESGSYSLLISVTGTQAIEASVAVTTGAVDWSTSSVTAATRQAKGERVVRETNEAAQDPI